MGQTTVNLPAPQRVGGFARHLTRGWSMGVRYRAAESGYLKSDAGGLWAGPGLSE